MERKNYRNANLPVGVPILNVLFEDVVIIFAIFMICLGISSLLSSISIFLSVFINVIAVFFCLAMLIFARRKKKIETELKGVSRAGVIRRYIPFVFGSDYLRGR